MGNKVRLNVHSSSTYVTDIELPEGKTIDVVFEWGMGIGFNPDSSMGSVSVVYYDNKTTKDISCIKVKQNKMVQCGSTLVDRVKIIDCETGKVKEL